MARQNIPINGSLTLLGELAGQVTVAPQAVAGGLQLLLPNVAPVANQALIAVAVNGFAVTLGWSSDVFASIASPTFTGTASFAHVASSGKDLAGYVTIDAGASSQAIVYDTPFTSTLPPVVVLTAIDDDPTSLGGVWVTHQQNTSPPSTEWSGFTVNVTNPTVVSPPQTQSFGYHVIST